MFLTFFSLVANPVGFKSFKYFWIKRPLWGRIWV